MERRLSVKLPADLHDRARAKSERTGVPLSFVIRQALRDWLEGRYEPEKEPEEEEPEEPEEERCAEVALAA